MTKTVTTFIFMVSSLIVFGQNIDGAFSQKKMKKDLKIFKEIRLKANSGLYKYRTEQQIDSIYNWAENKILESSTYLDFYNIICQLTDFEGSLHNETTLPEKYFRKLKEENYGYFPYPIKWIEGKWVINYQTEKIPLGSEILEINGVPVSQVIPNLYKYYTTDGQNITGKKVGIRKYFSEYYRLHYGQIEEFNVIYKTRDSEIKKNIILKSVNYSNYYKNFEGRYSKPYDQTYYIDLKENEKYTYIKLDNSTGILTINTFSMGNENTTEHKNYVTFLDSIFTKIKTENLKNLIVDVRINSGGTDPNDVITYSYLTSRDFQESKQAWISFSKIPLLKYFDISVPSFLRPLGVGKFNRHFQNRFPIKKGEKYFIGKKESEMEVRKPNKNTFRGKIYLLTSPEVASAGSLFASMVAGNKNTTVIGEETMGGYYGHNGHTSFGYVLPKSKIITDFSIDNIEQDVPKKSNQLYGRGIIPDHIVSQNYDDFLNQKDTQMKFTLELIDNEK